VTLPAKRRAVFLALCAAVAACVSVPNVDESVEGSNGTARAQIIGTHGPLTARQSKALFSRMDAAAQDTLQRHLAIEQAVAESPLVAGNGTHVLRDGAETFRAMFSAIRGATHHVNLEYFIFEDVESDGTRLGDLLVLKRQEGVAVNVIYDSYGSNATPSAFFDRLRQAGVKLVEFNPINPLGGAGSSYSPNDRDHRKILVVDGTTAIVGGVNLSTSYQGSLPRGSAGPADNPAARWRDTDLQIDGPAVVQLQQLFLEHWTRQKGPALADADFFPVIPVRGKEVVRIIGSTPDNLVPRYYVTVLSAIRNAETRIWLVAAYFVPTHQEKEDLIEAARRGVDVRLFLPDASDSSLAIAVQHSHYADLLEAGAKIYESHDEVLHSKTIIVDGVWSVIGSSNFDHRSVLFNDEVDAVIVGSDTARELERMFDDDLTKAHQIDLMAWHDRPISQTLKDVAARIWQSLL
jgi:cardiolipin synthase